MRKKTNCFPCNLAGKTKVEFSHCGSRIRITTSGRQSLARRFTVEIHNSLTASIVIGLLRHSDVYLRNLSEIRYLRETCGSHPPAGTLFLARWRH